MAWTWTCFHTSHGTTAFLKWYDISKVSGGRSVVYSIQNRKKWCMHGNGWNITVEIISLILSRNLLLTFILLHHTSVKRTFPHLNPASGQIKNHLSSVSTQYKTKILNSPKVNKKFRKSIVILPPFQSWTAVMNKAQWKKHCSSSSVGRCMMTPQTLAATQCQDHGLYGATSHLLC